MKPLTDERKNLIERYTVDADEAERLVEARSEKPEAPAGEAKPPVRGPKADVPARPHIAIAAEPVGNGEVVDVSRLGADADEARARFDEQARPAAEADEKRVAEEQARLAAEAEVSRLKEELARLTAEVEPMPAEPRRPRLEVAAEAGRTVEAQRTLKAVAEPIDVPPVEQTDPPPVEQTDVSPVEQTEVCQVDRWRGYLTCEFFASGPDGATVATSGAFRWRKSAPPPEDGPAREALDRLVAELLANGWEECGRGALWYERRFERPSLRSETSRDGV